MNDEGSTTGETDQGTDRQSSNRRSPRIFRSWTIAHAFILGILISDSAAKPPTLENLFPSGGSRGSTVEVTAAGQFERWPVRVWTSNFGLSITPGTEKGKLSVTIAADLAPGVYWLRLFDDEGSTTPRPFLVGLLPELNEVEPNDEPGKAQPLDASGVTVNGRLGKSGDVDGYRLTLKKGQTLIAAIEANNTLGSPMDAVLQVTSSDGFVLAQVDDEVDRDPRIVFEVPRDGDYLVRTFAFPFVQDSSIRFAGNPNYIYRLTMTTGGFADHAFPLAVTSGMTSEVEPIGWNIPAKSLWLKVDGTDESESVTLWNRSLAQPLQVRRVVEPTIVEVEPNGRDHPQQISLPVAVSGVIDKPGDVDYFTFRARKDEKLVFRLESCELGLPLDALLRISDASGTTIVEVDDARKTFDPEIRWTPPADGDYQISVRDLNRFGGPNYAYLLIAAPPKPDFRLALKADQWGVTLDKPLEIVVQVERVEGYAEPIEIELSGHVDGVIAEPVVSKRSGPTASAVTLSLRVCDCLKPGPIQIVGTARDARRRIATATIPGLSRSIDTAWLTFTKVPEVKPTVKPN